MIYKRGPVQWYEFYFKGERVRESTHQGNANEARLAEAAKRLELAREPNGTAPPPPPQEVPTLEAFKTTFMPWVRNTKKNERTQAFYETCYDRLCDYKEFAHAKLDVIDEPMIERFKLAQTVGKTSVNRYLATLRKALRYAWRKQKLIGKMPLIELYKREDGAERECEYVYTSADYKAWLAAAREPLRSASVLAHDGGICRGELLALERDNIDLRDRPDRQGFWGNIAIRRGLKRKARRRDIPITENMAEVLRNLLAQSKCQYVFTGHDHSGPLSVNTLADQHRAVMETCNFNPDAGLHALRHTFLT
jgi:integrase